MDTTNHPTRIVYHAHLTGEKHELQVYSPSKKCFYAIGLFKAMQSALDLWSEYHEQGANYDYPTFHLCLQSGYARSNKAKLVSEKTFHQMKLQEAKSLQAGSHVYFMDNNEDYRQAKVTSVKTWVTRPGACDVHLKYGMYEYAILSFTNGSPDGSIILLTEDAS